MATLEYIYETLDKNKWSIFLLIVLNILLYSLRYLKLNSFEGFQISPGVNETVSTSGVTSLSGIKVMHSIQQTPATHCPVYKSNIESNKQLLSKYKTENATVSIKNTEEVLKLFEGEYKVLNCDQYFASIGQTPTPQAVAKPTSP